MLPVLLAAIRAQVPWWLRIPWALLQPLMVKVIKMTLQYLFSQFSQPAPYGIAGYRLVKIDDTDLDPATFEPALLTAIAKSRLEPDDHSPTDQPPATDEFPPPEFESL
jgi:hypothetical protein